ncbi:MAG: hypothetical protein Q4F67_15975, partial [Propionibacteriaceae bacterium]|nr:hypothetical protein [Propionibacteriaceae bacterium]
MQIRDRIRGGAFACAIALAAGPITSAYAEPAGPALAASAQAIQADSCSTSTAQLSVISFNDFHGRIATASPDTVAFFGQIESYRAAAGEANSLVVSAGDNIGGSLFASLVQDDNPTLDILNAAELDATAVGNHEFDRGWPDLRDRVQDRANFPQLGANVYAAGTTAALLPEYELFERAG